MTKIGVQLCLCVLYQYSGWQVVWLNARNLYVSYDLVLLSVLFEVTWKLLCKMKSEYCV